MKVVGAGLPHRCVKFQAQGAFTFREGFPPFPHTRQHLHNKEDIRCQSIMEIVEICFRKKKINRYGYKKYFGSGSSRSKTAAKRRPTLDDFG